MRTQEWQEPWLRSVMVTHLVDFETSHLGTKDHFRKSTPFGWLQSSEHLNTCLWWTLKTHCDCFRKVSCCFHQPSAPTSTGRVHTLGNCSSGCLYQQTQLFQCSYGKFDERRSLLVPHERHHIGHQTSQWCSEFTPGPSQSCASPSRVATEPSAFQPNFTNVGTFPYGLSCGRVGSSHACNPAFGQGTEYPMKSLQRSYAKLKLGTGPAPCPAT